MIGKHEICPTVVMPNSVNYLNWALVFEWYVIWYGCKNEYQKDMCSK